MKKIVIIFILILFSLSVSALKSENSIYILAEKIAGEMGKEPFVVKVLYGEMLLNGGEGGEKREKPTASDLRAAAAAYGDYGFCGGAVNCKKWNRVKNTPLEMRSGVRVYKWYFYI